MDSAVLENRQEYLIQRLGRSKAEDFAVFEGFDLDARTNGFSRKVGIGIGCLRSCNGGLGKGGGIDDQRSAGFDPFFKDRIGFRAARIYSSGDEENLA